MVLNYRVVRAMFVATVPVIALAVFGVEAASSPAIGELPAVTEVALVAQNSPTVELATTDSPVLDVSTWEETAHKSPKKTKVKRGRRR